MLSAAKTLAIAPFGGTAGKKFEKLLLESGFPVEVIRIKQEIRVNMTVSDRQGLTIKLNEFGPRIEKAELEQIMRWWKSHVKKADWLMLCGSLPTGVPATFYSQLIEIAKKHKVSTLLDADGEPLLHGVEAGPTTAHPISRKAERLLNRALITRNHFFDAADKIHAMGAASVLLSLGSRGAVARELLGDDRGRPAAHRCDLSHWRGRRGGSGVSLVYVSQG